MHLSKFQVPNIDIPGGDRKTNHPDPKRGDFFQKSVRKWRVWAHPYLRPFCGAITEIWKIWKIKNRPKKSTKASKKSKKFARFQKNNFQNDWGPIQGRKLNFKIFEFLFFFFSVFFAKKVGVAKICTFGIFGCRTWKKKYFWPKNFFGPLENIFDHIEKLFGVFRTDLGVARHQVRHIWQKKTKKKIWFPKLTPNIGFRERFENGSKNKKFFFLFGPAKKNRTSLGPKLDFLRVDFVL